MLENLYEEIYQDEQDFHGAGSFRFEDENEDHDDDVDVSDVDNEADDVDFEPKAVDPNLDTEVPVDDTEVEVLPRKRKFRSPSDVCDERNYEALPAQEPRVFEWKNKKGASLKWTTQRPSSETNPKRAGRRSAKNLSVYGGLTNLARRNSDSPGTIWSYMISDDLLMKVVNNTNKKISLFLETNQHGLENNDKETHFKLTSLRELKAWFGLLYLRVAFKLNGMNADVVFYHESSHDIFSATMQRKRFSLLSNIIQFDDVG